MADEITGQIFGATNIGGSLSTMTDIVLWVLVIGLLIGAAYLVYYLFSFKNVLIVRDAANNKKIIKRFKWKVWKDKKKNVWLITPFKRIKKPLPPYEAIELTPRGKMWVEAWRGEDSESLIYVKDSFDYNKYQEGHPEFQPLTTQERELLIEEVATSEAYKKKTGWDIALQLMPWIVPIIMVLIIMMGVGDFAAGVNEIGSPLAGAVESLGSHIETASNNLAGIQTPPENIIDGGGVPN